MKLLYATAQRFFDLCHSVGVSGETVTEAWLDLILHYSEPHRFYHTLDHIDRMLGWLDASAVRNASIEFAIWYHDVIYDPKSVHNESLSADFFHSWIGARISPDLASDIKRLILATDHRKHRSHVVDESLIIDIDLSILGESGDVYDEYSRHIRLEYLHVADAAYEQGRKEVLSGFLERTIFTNLPFLSLEPIARENILREIATLKLARNLK